MVNQNRGSWVDYKIFLVIVSGVIDFRVVVNWLCNS